MFLQRMQQCLSKLVGGCCHVQRLSLAIAKEQVTRKHLILLVWKSFLFFCFVFFYIYLVNIWWQCIPNSFQGVGHDICPFPVVKNDASYNYENLQKENKAIVNYLDIKVILDISLHVQKFVLFYFVLYQLRNFQTSVFLNYS